MGRRLLLGGGGGLSRSRGLGERLGGGLLVSRGRVRKSVRGVVDFREES